MIHDYARDDALDAAVLAPPSGMTERDSSSPFEKKVERNTARNDHEAEQRSDECDTRPPIRRVRDNAM